MPYFANDGASVWFPLVFPILFPLIFPMGFMMFFMIRRGGPMGMMGGHQSHHDERPPPSRSRAEPTAHEGTTPIAETPLEIAQRRYAAGEISRSEFLSLREDLE